MTIKYSFKASNKSLDSLDQKKKKSIFNKSNNATLERTKTFKLI